MNTKTCEHADTPRDNRTNPIIVTWCFPSPRQQYRDCAIVSGSVSILTSLHIHASYSIPNLSPFLFMPSLYALLFVIHRIFYLLVSTHFYTWLSWKRLNTHTHQVSPPCVLSLVSLRSEEIIIPKVIFCWRLSWKRLHAYQVSPPCMVILSKFEE